jgi:hypothetical protein
MSRFLLSVLIGPGIIAMLSITSLPARAADDNDPPSSNQLDATLKARHSTADTHQPVVVSNVRAGYPRNHEMWRYCPPDQSHPCVDLDIPGVTAPEPAVPAK